MYNNEFLKIDNEKKAYLLGLLYADGCISKATKEFYVLSLAMTNEDLIKKIHSDFPFFHYSARSNNKGYGNGNNLLLHILRKQDKNLSKHMLNNGLIPKKSMENKDINKMPILEDNLIRHFIRGYFDGDGSIYIFKHRPNLRRFEICGNGKIIMEEMYKILLKICPSTTIRLKKNNSSGIFDMHTIEIMKSEDILKLKDFLYKDATLYMTCKKDLFDSFKVIKPADKHPNCPKCNCSSCLVNNSIEKIGNYMSQKYYCKICKKYTRIKILSQ
jgi:DNA-binding transcriptional regulator WhiA